MNTRLLLVAGVSAALAFSGCGKKDKDKGGDKADKGNQKTAGGGGGGVDKAADSVIGGKADVDLDKIITSETAMPFGALKLEMLGMPKDELAKIDPKLVDVMGGLVKDGVTYNTYSGRPMADGDPEKFLTHTLEVSFYADFKYVNWKDVNDKLVEKWGKPIDHADFNLVGATSHFWFNPENGVRAMLNGYDEERAKMGFAAKVKFQRYLPLDKWLGAPDQPFPFLKEGKELIGMSAADMMSMYEYEIKKGSASSLPYMLRTEWDGDLPPSVTVWANEDESAVQYYTISLKYEDHPDGPAPFEAAIKAKYPGKELGADNEWVEVAPNTKARHEPGMKAYTIQVGERAQ